MCITGTQMRWDNPHSRQHVLRQITFQLDGGLHWKPTIQDPENTDVRNRGPPTSVLTTRSATVIVRGDVPREERTAVITVDTGIQWIQEDARTIEFGPSLLEARVVKTLTDGYRS